MGSELAPMVVYVGDALFLQLFGREVAFEVGHRDVGQQLSHHHASIKVEGDEENVVVKLIFSDGLNDLAEKMIALFLALQWLDLKKQLCMLFKRKLFLNCDGTCFQKLVECGDGLTVFQGKCLQLTQRVERRVTDDVALHFTIVKHDGDIVGGELHIKLSAFEAIGKGMLHGGDAVFGRAFRAVKTPMGYDAWFLCFEGILRLLS